MESPRAIPQNIFTEIGGYNEHIAGGEDWEITQRIRDHGSIVRIEAPIRHNEGRLTLQALIKKRLYYARGFADVYTTRKSSPLRDTLRLYGLFFSKPSTAFRHPVQWLCLIFMKTTELTASAVVYATSKRKPKGTNA